MFTFVIDIHGGLSNFDNTAPFLYPVRDQLYIVPLSANKFTNISEAAENVHKYLDRNFLEQWQVVFLVDLEIRHPNPFIGSMTYYLYAIEEKFLAPLKTLRLIPQDIFVIAVDSVERGQRGKPLEPGIALRWELDIKGFCSDSNDDDFIFGKKEIKQLDSLWDKKLSIHYEKFGRGLQSLSPELQNELKTRVEKLEKGIDELLEKKKEQFLKSKVQDEITEKFMRQSWKDIRTEFLARIKQILLKPDSAAALEDFAPAGIMKDVIKNYIGIGSDYISQEFLMLRFPFPRGPHQNFQKKILELTFLLIAIAESDLGSRFNISGPHEVEISLKENDQEFPQLLYDYRQCLQLNFEDLKQKISSPIPISLYLPGYNTQKCDQELPKEKINGIGFNFFLDNDAVTGLNSWKNQVIGTVKNTDKARHENIGKCMEQTYRTKTPETKKDIFDCRGEARRLKREYLSRIERLPQEDFASPPDPQFDSFMAEKERKLQAELYRRPTKNQFLLISTLSFLILYLSILINLNKIGEYVAWGGVSLLFALVAGFLCREDFSKRISLLVKEIIGRAEGVILRIRDRFERQKSYLLDLFNVDIARKNYYKVEKAVKQENESKRRSKFFYNEVEMHLIKANNLCELYPLPDETYEGLAKKDFLDLDFEKPIFQNRIYSSAAFRKHLLEHGYKIGIDEGFSDQASHYIFVVDKINLKKDSFYRDV